MPKKSVALIATALLAGGLTVGTAQGATASTSAAGCGAGFQLVTVEQAFDLADLRPYAGAEGDVLAAIAGEDGNGDGLVCVKQFKPNQGQDKYWGFENYSVVGILDNRAVGRA